MEKLKPYHANICFMAEYFLPDVNHWASVPCQYETKVLTPDELEQFYLPQWSNALSLVRPHFDQLGVGAYCKGQLIGLAGCSADCDTMWQIRGGCFA